MIDMGAAHHHCGHHHQHPTTRPPNRTDQSTNSSNPSQSINNAAATNPASATSYPSSKTTPKRSMLYNTPLTGSAPRLRAKTILPTVIDPDQRHFPRLPNPNHRTSIGGSRLRGMFR